MISNLSYPVSMIEPDDRFERVETRDILDFIASDAAYSEKRDAIERKWMDGEITGAIFMKQLRDLHDSIEELMIELRAESEKGGYV